MALFSGGIIQSIDTPDTAYENAKQRYQDIGEWFGRKESFFVDNDPHIFPQGSFRLGTVIRPLSDMEEYDLDLGCEFEKGISKRNFTQYQLKHDVGNELEKYRSYRGIQEKLEEKHRCWRLNYQDHLKFHMDIVPCIPEDAETRRTIEEAILRENLDERLASEQKVVDEMRTNN